MTPRDEDKPRVLIFADILGFEQMTREIRVRVEDYPEDEHGISGSGTTELQGRFVRFSSVLDWHVSDETYMGGIQAMLFSDCGFLVYENALRAALAATSLMRAFIRRGVPVRMGLGKGTFYDMEYATATTADQSRVVSKSRFYGTAVIHAHEAERCDSKGMRIFLHDSLDEDLVLIRNRLRPMKLKKPLRNVNYELDYFHEPGPIGESPPSDEQDRALFAKVAILKNPGWPNKVLRQYSETFAAMNRMRKANSCKRVAAHRLPVNAPHGTIW